MKTHLIVGDSHVSPGQDLSRFDWLGNLIADVRPDVVINIGDFFDMPSLCSYDMGTGSFEGRRLQKDLAVGHEAIDRIMAPLRKRKKKLPRLVSLEGNHEYRLTKAIERNHTLLYDIVSNDSYQWEDQGWEFYAYDGGAPAIVELDGIYYRHFMTTNATSNAMSGINLAASIVQATHKTTVVGHSHHFDVHRRVAISGEPIWGIVAGSFIDKSSEAFKYAGPSVSNWWSGVVILEGVSSNSFEDFSIVSYNTLKDTYNA